LLASLRVSLPMRVDALSPSNAQPRVVSEGTSGTSRSSGLSFSATLTESFDTAHADTSQEWCKPLSLGVKSKDSPSKTVTESIPQPSSADDSPSDNEARVGSSPKSSGKSARTIGAGIDPGEVGVQPKTKPAGQSRPRMLDGVTASLALPLSPEPLSSPEIAIAMPGPPAALPLVPNLDAAIAPEAGISSSPATNALSGPAALAIPSPADEGAVPTQGRTLHASFSSATPVAAALRSSTSEILSRAIADSAPATESSAAILIGPAGDAWSTAIAPMPLSDLPEISGFCPELPLSSTSVAPGTGEAAAQNDFSPAGQSFVTGVSELGPMNGAAREKSVSTDGCADPDPASCPRLPSPPASSATAAGRITLPEIHTSETARDNGDASSTANLIPAPGAPDVQDLKPTASALQKALNRSARMEQRADNDGRSDAPTATSSSATPLTTGVSTPAPSAFILRSDMGPGQESHSSELVSTTSAPGLGVPSQSADPEKPAPAVADPTRAGDTKGLHRRFPVTAAPLTSPPASMSEQSQDSSPAISPATTAANDGSIASSVAPPVPSGTTTAPADSPKSDVDSHQMLDRAPLPSTEAPTFGAASLAERHADPATLQMHVGVHTRAFGNVEIQTVLAQHQVGISVHGDHDLARWFNSEVGGLEAGLKNQHLNLAAVDFGNDRRGVQTATSFQQGQPRRDLSPNSGPGRGVSPDEESAESRTESAPSVLSAGSHEARVSILV